MSPEELRSFRKATSLSQRQLAEALGVEVELVRAWEAGQRFPTKAHCDAMAGLRDRGPKPAAPDAAQLFADPAFLALLRKLLAHPALREKCLTAARDFEDPAGS